MPHTFILDGFISADQLNLQHHESLISHIFNHITNLTGLSDHKVRRSHSHEPSDHKVRLSVIYPVLGDHEVRHSLSFHHSHELVDHKIRHSVTHLVVGNHKVRNLHFTVYREIIV